MITSFLSLPPPLRRSEVGEMQDHREAAFFLVILEVDHAAIHRNESVMRGDRLRLLLGERDEPAHELEAPHRVVTAPARRIAAAGQGENL